jgi:hypothetical protein
VPSSHGGSHWFKSSTAYQPIQGVTVFDRGPFFLILIWKNQRLMFFYLPAENSGEEVAMETGLEFIQRMQEDAEFRRKVNACPNGGARLEFLKKEGYDFTPFVQIMDSLSSGEWPAGGLPRPGGSSNHKQGASGLLGRLSQFFRTAKEPRPNR